MDIWIFQTGNADTQRVNLNPWSCEACFPLMRASDAPSGPGGQGVAKLPRPCVISFSPASMRLGNLHRELIYAYMKELTLADFVFWSCEACFPLMDIH